MSARRSALAALTAAIALTALSGCGGAAQPSPDPSTAPPTKSGQEESAPDDATTTAIAALSQISAEATGIPSTHAGDDPGGSNAPSGGPDAIYFSSPQALPDSPEWRSLTASPLLKMNDPQKAMLDLKIDLESADLLVSTGSAPGNETLISGGIDDTAVAAAAKSLGYVEGKPLPIDLQHPLTMSVAQVETGPDRVVLGGNAAPMTTFPDNLTHDSSVLGDPAYAGVSDCLSSTVAALVLPSATPGRIIGAGVTPTDDGTTTVICQSAPDADAAKQASAVLTSTLDSGTTPTGESFASLFPQSSITVIGTTVQAKLENGASIRPTTFADLYIQRGLPGQA